MTQAQRGPPCGTAVRATREEVARGEVGSRLVAEIVSSGPRSCAACDARMRQATGCVLERELQEEYSVEGKGSGNQRVTLGGN